MPYALPTLSDVLQGRDRGGYQLAGLTGLVRQGGANEPPDYRDEDALAKEQDAQRDYLANRGWWNKMRDYLTGAPPPDFQSPRTDLPESWERDLPRTKYARPEVLQPSGPLPKSVSPDMSADPPGIMGDARPAYRATNCAG
jgi:hypothetical protein